MFLLVALGNPGARYAGNRHNVGFMSGDAIAARHGFGPERTRFQAVTREGTVETAAGAEKVLLLKPQTYMNLSGNAVAEAVQFYKLGLDRIAVLHDELDLPPGRVRVKVGGGHAGNNGIRSIAAAVGPDFKRVRIGIGHPGDKSRVTGHVLSDFSKADAAWLDPLLEEIARSVSLLIEGRDADFVRRCAQALPPPPEGPAPAGGDDRTG
ncbi:MAG: aminoacyl-tRNA hydrolase [Alphaproteobacteria bacterium]|nr:aminoacyl-tRNA hydrolase [Alphaproteobacteria bacterium]